MKRLIAIALLAFGPLALAEPCKEHQDSVKAAFKNQDWKLVSYTSDDDILSTTFRKDLKDGSVLTSFVYTANTLLVNEATMRGFETLAATCTLNGLEVKIMVRSTKEVKT